MQLLPFTSYNLPLKMATSAFKSTSKRPNSSSSSSSTTVNNNKPPSQQQTRKHQNSTQKTETVPRRSRSVSAFSRTRLDTTSEFQNKRDNPLFWVDGLLNSEEHSNGIKDTMSDIEIPKFAGVDNSKGCSEFGGDSRRGRSISRVFQGERRFSGDGGGGGGGGRKGIGRSLSRVQRRSPGHGNSESEREQGSEWLNVKSKSKISSSANRNMLAGKRNLVRSASDLSEVLNGRNRWSSQHPSFETSDDTASNLSGSRIPCWDDGMSTSSISEAEEKTIKPVSWEKKMVPLTDGAAGGILETVRSEVRLAISDMQNDLKYAMLRSNSDGIHSSVISDLAPEEENSDTVGLVTDFREEFERELEECEERARKLRAELAAEEHREFELNEMLNDIVPEPKTPLMQKPRAARKASYERKKMSKHLEEEALAYFDECVSISTFDESEFSSIEDLQPNLVSADGTGSERIGLPEIPSRAGIAFSLESQDDALRTPVMQHNEDCDSSHRSSYDTSVTKPQFSFTSKPSTSTTSLEEDIKSYVKVFRKNSGVERKDSQMVSTSYKNTVDYNCEVPRENLLFDRVTFRSRIDSGSLILCGGGFGFSLPPFSSV